ncbi:MAG: acyl carrier protein [Nocardiaceae bacterium]|nr:acyl carrier protein [Nocardiaceae bacterium]
MSGMTEHIFAALQSVAPEVDRADIDAQQPLRDQVDLDSMDWMTFLAELQARTGAQIPARDTHRLRSIDDLSEYLARQLGESTAPIGTIGPGARG